MPQKVSSEREPELSLTGNPQIAVESLSYTYDPGLPTEREALSSVELQVHPGECLGLIGPSGSGKTTLTQHFNGLLQPTQGRVLVDGIDLSIKRIDLKPIRQKIGLVFQSPEFQLFEDTVYADVAFGPRSLGWSPAEVDRRVREALGGVGLDFEVFAHRSPFSLSQGEKRRVAIAGVLALGPQVLILDEPTAGLDPQGVKQMVAILRELQTRGTTLIVISHHLEFIARLAQRAIVLHRGQVVAEGPFPGVLLEGGLLENLGFELPPLVALGVKLREWGWELGPDGFTPEGIKEGLLRNLWEAKSPSSERDHTYPL